MSDVQRRMVSLEVCAGAGGMALGLEQAGFDPFALVDNRDKACLTLRANRPKWQVLERDLLRLDPRSDLPDHDEIDLLAAGLPRVRSAATASRARGDGWELELLETTGRWVWELRPRAVLLENVPDLIRRSENAQSRSLVEKHLDDAGYEFTWKVLNASNFGIPQHRELGVLVAFRDGGLDRFEAAVNAVATPSNMSVGAVLRTSMAARGWLQADQWAAYADRIAPTVVGGSWDRGGADLGPSGSQRAWAGLGVQGKSLADRPPAMDFDWDPADPERHVRLTVDQVAQLQGFPASWEICGRKTARYRQIGSATPPAVARGLGSAIRMGLIG
ncbi:DNA cytosine methyltransferase [Nocardia asteroides]|uniref:DNA cytosine methyltransferase n=1 Tax=Nocardia asteroides TaxID=1824 RepID=UPI0033D696C1